MNDLYQIERYRKAWAVKDNQGNLIVLALYKKGACEVKARLEHLAARLSELEEHGAVSDRERLSGTVRSLPPHD